LILLNNNKIGKNSLWVWGSPERESQGNNRENTSQNEKSYVDPNYLFQNAPVQLPFNKREGKVIKVVCSSTSCLILTGIYHTKPC